MKLQLSIDTENQQDLIDASLLLNYYLKPGNKTAAAESLKKNEAAKPVTKKKASPVVEEDEDEEEVDFDSEDEEIEEEDTDGEEESEDDEVDFDDEDEEEEVKPTKKAASKPAQKSTPAKAVAPTSKLKLEDVIKACQETHKKLEKKLKSKEKAQAKINGVLKAHGAKSTRSLDVKKYSAAIKDIKALAA